MENKKLNIFILNNNTEAAGKLRRCIKGRFGNEINISLFYNSKKCVNPLCRHTHLVVIDDYLYEWGSNNTNRTELLKMIKDKSPETVVVILKSNADIGQSIEAMQYGNNAYVINKIGTWQHLQNIIDHTVGQPIKYLVAEFGVKKFMKVFFLTV